MRIVFIRNGSDPRPGEPCARSRKELAKLAPWASVFVKTDGGWKAFESADDLKTWEKQK